MSTWLVDQATRVLGPRISRRGFFSRAALLGSAMVVAPIDYILRPQSAYAAICSCVGQSCECGSKCCDGYTEFCCTITGSNSCPPGTTVAGWWKADGSGFCDDGSPQPRYYYDCNASCNGCGCGSSGLCSNSCSSFDCECTNKNCNLRKTSCTSFRYGQCNQDVECLGPIVCRVVTCTPPWVWDPECTSTTATDNNTRFHDAACLHLPVSGTGYVVVGDWDGSGIQTPGIFDRGTWYLTDRVGADEAKTVFDFGKVGDVPVVGDWNGDGIDTVGVFRDGLWLLRNSNTAGDAHVQFSFGRTGDYPVVGKWTGGATSGIGVVRGSTWLLRFSPSAGAVQRQFDFGDPLGIPLSGDWNGSGTAGVGRYLDGRWQLAHDTSSPTIDLDFTYGTASDIPVPGDWDGSGSVTIGIVQRADWGVRNTNSAGPTSTSFTFGIGQQWPHGYVDGRVGRIWGSDRYATAADAMEITFAGGARRVFVATGEFFPDALVAGVAGDPVLLMRKDVLPSETRSAILALDPAEITVLGGEAVISKTGFDQLVGLAPTLRRVAGATRYHTAVELNKQLFPGSADRVFLASGEVFTDALAVVPVAGALGRPLLLSRSDELPSVVEWELRRIGANRVDIVGGTVSISSAVATKLKSMGITVTRIYGSDRYSTAAEIQEVAYTGPAERVFIVSGLEFPDALSAGPCAVAGASPMLYVQSGAIPGPTASALKRLDPRQITVVGGPDIISPAVEVALQAYASG